MSCCLASSPSRAMRLQPAPLGELELVELARRVEVGQPDLRGGAGLDPLGQPTLLGRGEQRHPADLLQVHPHRVGGAPVARSAVRPARPAGGDHRTARGSPVAPRRRRARGAGSVLRPRASSEPSSVSGRRRPRLRPAPRRTIAPTVGSAATASVGTVAQVGDGIGGDLLGLVELDAVTGQQLDDLGPPIEADVVELEDLEHLVRGSPDRRPRDPAPAVAGPTDPPPRGRRRKPDRSCRLHRPFGEPG